MIKIEIPLDIPDVEVVDVTMDENGAIIITVESCLEDTCCRVCGRRISKFHGHGRLITLRHLSILGRKTYIQIQPKRHQCPYCDVNPTSTQRSVWYDERSPHTKAYDEHLLCQLINSTIEDVSQKEDVGYDAVEGMLNRWVDTEVKWNEIDRIEVLGIDEIALKKGHKDFVTIVSGRDEDQMHILAVLPDRKKETVKAFFLRIPQPFREHLTSVCCDLNEGFLNAAKEVFGDTVVVADRFHVAHLYRKSVETLRKQELKRLKQVLPKDEYAKLKGVMWSLRKAPTELTLEDTERLTCLFTHSPPLKTAYALCQELTDLFEREMGKEAAEQNITAWTIRVQDSGLTCFKTFLSTLDKWRNEITNYFLARHTSGFVEGLNNKIKVIKRRCYGIFNVNHLFQRIYLDLKGYSLMR